MVGPLANREWRVIPVEQRTAPLQMALEEVAARTARNGGPRTVRVYKWSEPTLSLGYRQPIETVDRDFCDRHGITLTRRQTGGGGIYHHPVGDIAYSIIAPRSELPQSVTAGYQQLCQPIIDGFARLGINAGFATTEQPGYHEPACYLRSISPAHDLVVERRKISGTAQNRQRETVIQHGSISYRRYPSDHLGCFVDPEIDPELFRDRVTAIREQCDCAHKRAIEALQTALTEWAQAEPGEWQDTELTAARELAERKYANENWIVDRQDQASDRSREK